MDRDKQRRLTISELRREKLSGVAAASILAQRNSATDVIRISRMLNNPDPVIREGTIKSLAQSGGRDAAMAVVRCVRDRDPGVRAAACKALGQMRAHSAKAPLYDALYDSSYMVCCCAAGALAAMGDKIGLAQVMKLLCSSGRHQREALRSLNMITGRNFRVNADGLRQAIHWVAEQKKQFLKKS